MARVPDATAEVKLSLSQAGGKRNVEISGVDDENFKKCASLGIVGVVARDLGDEEAQGSLRVALYPRAASAPILHEAPEGVSVERWKEDGSCWTSFLECAPKKICRAPEPVRVVCPVARSGGN